MNPLSRLLHWVQEERNTGAPFSHGAVLGTTGRDGSPRTRMLGVHFDEEGWPRFHTSPGSRKVEDIELNPRASLTFAFQHSLRSVSLEGTLEPIPRHQLSKDWLALEPSFRRSYLVFGHRSGLPLDAAEALEQALQALPPGAEDATPDSFIGYRFTGIGRIAFYSVGTGPFAQHEVFTHCDGSKEWRCLRVVP